MQMILKKTVPIFFVVFNFILVDVSYGGADDTADTAKLSKASKMRAGVASAAKGVAKSISPTKSIKGLQESGGKMGASAKAVSTSGATLQKGLATSRASLATSRATVSGTVAGEDVEKEAKPGVPGAPDVAKTPEQIAAEKRAAQLAKPLTPKPGEAEKTVVKTPAQEEAEKAAAKKVALTDAQQRVKDLIKRQFQLGGESEDPLDKGFWDKQFLKLGTSIALKFPNQSSAMMEKALALNQKVRQSRLGRYSDALKSVSDDVKAQTAGRMRSHVAPVLSKDIAARKMENPKEWEAARKEVFDGTYAAERKKPEWQDRAVRLMAEGKTDAEVEKVVRSEIEEAAGKSQFEGSREQEEAYKDERGKTEWKKRASELKAAGKTDAEVEKIVRSEIEIAAGKSKIHGIYPAERNRAKWDDRAKQLVAEGKTPEQAERIIREEIEKSIKDEVDKAAEAPLRDAISKKNLDDAADKRLQFLKAKNPKKLAKMLSKTEKRLGADSQKFSQLAAQKKLTLDQLKELMEKDPAFKNDVLRESLTEEIKRDLKTTTYAKLKKFSDEWRQKNTSGKPMVLFAVLQVAFAVLAIGIEKAVEKALVAEVGAVVVDKPKAIGGSQDVYGSDELTPEDQKNMDALETLAAFYSKFDEKFKQVLSGFDYYAATFQTSENVKFAGGSLTAGIALLFDYQGAGNIADGLTPVFMRFYPMQILGKAIDPMQVMVGVSNLDALEIVSFLRAGSPDVIFFLKAISLLNTANKKVADLAQRDTFFTEQINLIFARFLRTIDDDATRRANIIEKDYEKWDPVYMKNPAKCFQSAPKVLRDFMAGLNVSLLNENGAKIEVPFEKYIVTKFDEFDDVLNIEFEGDVDYEVEARALGDTALYQQLLAVFMRALDDVLLVERDLRDEKAPVTIRDAQGKEQKFDSKNFFMTVTNVAYKKFQSAQVKLVDAMVEVAADLTNADLAKRYNVSFKEYNSALDAYLKSTLEFRKKACFYPYEKTLGYEPERVFDFVKRECKRAYLDAKNKEYFLSVLPKIFEPFAGNFPFSVQDILLYSQEPGPVKSPVRVFIEGFESVVKQPVIQPVVDPLPVESKRDEAKKLDENKAQKERQVIEQRVAEVG